MSDTACEISNSDFSASWPPDIADMCLDGSRMRKRACPYQFCYRGEGRQRFPTALVDNVVVCMRTVTGACNGSAVLRLLGTDKMLVTWQVDVHQMAGQSLNEPLWPETIQRHQPDLMEGGISTPLRLPLVPLAEAVLAVGERSVH